MIFQTKAAPLILTLYFQWPETEKSLFGMRWHLVHLSQRKVPALFHFRNSTEIWRKRSVTDTLCVCFLVWVSYGLGRCCKLTDVQSEILVFWGGTERPQQRELLSQTHLEPSIVTASCGRQQFSPSGSVWAPLLSVVMNRPIASQAPLESECLSLEKRMWWEAK